MTDVISTDDDDPLADPTLYPPGRMARRLRLTLRLIVALAVAAVVVWQLVTLHRSIHQLHGTTGTQAQQIQQLHTNLTNLQNGVTAAVSCLQTAAPAEKVLCGRFLP